tara:strand:+ start:277 stop:912 length:636 start_codon:yes stop_codon:yes gene_type:complete
MKKTIFEKIRDHEGPRDGPGEVNEHAATIEKHIFNTDFGPKQSSDKSPDYGHPSQLVPRFTDYCQKLRGTAKFTQAFFDHVVRKCIVPSNDGKTFSIDEDFYNKEAAHFFEQTFVKSTIDPDQDRCISTTVYYVRIEDIKEPDLPDNKSPDFPWDPEESQRIFDTMEAAYPTPEIDISKLHKCGEIHIPIGRFESDVWCINKEGKEENETI